MINVPLLVMILHRTRTTTQSDAEFAKVFVAILLILAVISTAALAYELRYEIIFTIKKLLKIR